MKSPFLTGFWFCLCCLYLAEGGPAVRAASTVQFGPTPSWVAPASVVDLSATPTELTTYGLHHLFLDRQVHAGERATYIRRVYRVTADSSLQSAAEFSVDFEPSYQELTLHHLRVLRGGETQERLQPGLVQVIQQERDLQRSMLNGQLTALIMLADVRVGDVLDFAFTRAGTNPVFGSHVLHEFRAGWSMPIRHQRARLVVPRDSRVRLWPLGEPAMVIEASEQNDERVYLWEGRDLQAVDYDDNLPSWYEPLPSVEVTDFGDWAEVTAWAEPLYQIESPLPPEVVEEAARLTKDKASAEAKAIALLQFVQQEVRYLGLELGPNTHQPNPPALVLSRRFGDCKDKVVLFCALMRAAGLEAWPALVNTDRRHQLSRAAPSPHAFDHVIAAIPQPDGGWWWVDPTLMHQQGGRQTRGMPDYGLALLVQPGSDRLVTVDLPAGAAHRTWIEETFDSPSFEEPAEFRVKTRYAGRAADSIRGYFSRMTAEQVLKDYVNYYAASFPGVAAAGPVRWQDDEVANMVTVEEAYTITGLWEKTGSGNARKVEFYPRYIANLASRPDRPVRSMPLHISHPVMLELETRAKLPADWNLDPYESMVETVAFRAYDRSHMENPRTMVMRYGWESRQDHVPPEALAEHVETVNRFRNNLSYVLTHDPDAVTDTVPGRLNWMLVLVALVATGSAGAGARWVYARPGPAVPPPLPPSDAETRLVGLRGWLILLGIGLTVSPIRLGLEIVTTYREWFQQETWDIVTTPGLESYIPGFTVLAVGELAANIFLFVGSILTVVMFYGRRRRFPVVAAAFIGSAVLVLAADLVAVEIFFPKLTEIEASEIKDLMRSIIYAAIWIPYLFVSRRVKLTFTR